MVTKITDAYMLVGSPLVPTSLLAPDGTPVPLRGYGGGRVLHVCSAGFPGDDLPNNFYTSLGGSGGALEALGGRSNKGDTILVYPGHSENVSAADYMSLTGAAAGFSIIGLGHGAQRPSLYWTAATSTWLIDTAGVEIANMNLYFAGSSAATTLTVTTPMTVSAAGFRLIGCYVQTGLDTNTGCGSTLGAIAFTTAADDCLVAGNMFDNQDTAGTLMVSCLSLNGADRIRIVHNQFTGGTTSTTVGQIHCVTTLSANIVIADNYVENLKASSTKAITSAIAGVTGTIARNSCRVQSGIVAYTIASTPFLCSFFDNKTSDADTLNGALDVANGTAT